MSASALLRSRVKRSSYLSKLAHPKDLIDLFPHGSYIGWSGFTGVGYPKYVAAGNHLDGDDLCPIQPTNMNTCF